MRDATTTKKATRAKAKKAKVIYSTDRPERDAEGMACPCGGFADVQNDMTQEEVDEMQRTRGSCGRFHQCCARAFKCRLCKSRILANAQAPEMG